MNAKWKVAAVGDLGSIIGFRGMMMETHPVLNEEEARKTLHELIQSEQYAVIYVTRLVATQCAAQIAAGREKMLPAVIVIPQAGGDTTQGGQALKEAVKKAIGFDILRDDIDVDDALDDENQTS